MRNEYLFWIVVILEIFMPKERSFNRISDIILFQCLLEPFQQTQQLFILEIVIERYDRNTIIRLHHKAMRRVINQQTILQSPIGYKPQIFGIVPLL